MQLTRETLPEAAGKTGGGRRGTINDKNGILYHLKWVMRVSERQLKIFVF